MGTGLSPGVLAGEGLRLQTSESTSDPV